MTVQSLKTLDESNLDLEDTQVLNMGGGHLRNKMADVKCFSEAVPLDPKINTGNLNLISLVDYCFEFMIGNAYIPAFTMTYNESAKTVELISPNRQESFIDTTPLYK